MPHPPRAPPHWRRSPVRVELLALYAQTDALLAGWTCSCARDPTSTAPPEPPACCHFAVTGREPHPTAVELEEVRHCMRAAGIVARDRRKLPLADLGRCPLLSAAGTCRVYASRPFGCRTFFCRDAQGPIGADAKARRDAVNAIGRLIADLSARFDPRDPQPRALTKSLG